MEQNLPIWDLSSLFKTPEECLKAVTVFKKSIIQFCKQYKNKITTPEILLKSIQSYENIIDGMHRIGTFAYLNYITQMNDNEKRNLYTQVSDMLTISAAELSFFTLEINKLPNEAIINEVTKKYKIFLENICLYKKYELPEAIEQVLLKKSITSSSAWSKFFDETITRLRFSYEEKSLTASQIFDQLCDANAEIREKSAKSIGATLKNNIETFAFITNTLAKDKSIEDEMRGFIHPISSRNMSNLIEDDIVNSLIKSVQESYKTTSHKYYKLKAKIFNKEKLEYWDRNAPMPFNSNVKYSFEEAKNITLEAYQEFSPRMARIAKSFFEKNWIDAKPSDYKDSGAFSHPASTSSNPFVMLNFFGKIRDVATIAHELGHGVHQFLARKQGSLLCQTPLTLAETASVFGEQLIFQKMLKNAQSKEQKLEMLSSKIEDMINTSIRQIAFCDFELQIHNKRKSYEIAPEEINSIWLNIQKKSLGDIFNFDNDYQYYWSYIPHFIHSPFYVYAYAFGDILVNSLYNTYLSGNVKNFEEKYITMLEMGGALHHKELLEPFGIDISKNDFWLNGMKVLENMITEFENLITTN